MSRAVVASSYGKNTLIFQYQETGRITNIVPATATMSVSTRDSNVVAGNKVLDVAFIATGYDDAEITMTASELATINGQSDLVATIYIPSDYSLHAYNINFGFMVYDGAWKTALKSLYAGHGTPYTGFQKIRIKPSDFSSAVNWSAATKIRVRMQAPSGMTLGLDAIEVYGHTPATCRVMMDDGYADTITYGLPVWTDLNIPVTYNIITSLIGTSSYATKASLLELDDLVLIGNHSSTTSQSGGDDLANVATVLGSSAGFILDTAFAAEVLAARDWMVSNGFEKGAHYHALPGGYSDDISYAALVAEGFRMTRGPRSLNWTINPSQTAGRFDPQILRGDMNSDDKRYSRGTQIGLDGAATSAAAIAAIDAAVLAKEHFIILSHQYAASGLGSHPSPPTTSAVVAAEVAAHLKTKINQGLVRVYDAKQWDETFIGIDEVTPYAGHLGYRIDTSGRIAV